MDITKQEQTPKLAEGYINVFQGQIGRYIQDETSKHYLGLYTDEITTCIIIVIYGLRENKPCFSLIHADPSISLEQIEKEKQWVGKSGEMYIIKHAQSAIGLNEKLQKITKRTIKLIKEEHDAVVITPNGQEPNIETLNSEENSLTLYNHKYAMRLYATYKFNIMHAEIYGQLKINLLLDQKKIITYGNMLLYDNRAWSSYSLSEHFQKELNYPASRLLFDGALFCHNNNGNPQLIPFAQETYNAINTETKNQENITFKEIYIEFMKFIHKKEYKLNKHELEQYYAGQCTELARMYCYLTNNITLLKKDKTQHYWLKTIDRYSKYIAPPEEKIQEKIDDSSAVSNPAAVISSSKSNPAQNTDNKINTSDDSTSDSPTSDNSLSSSPRLGFNG